MGWEGFNTFKKILLFSIEKGFKEVILSKGYLPILISDTQKTYLQGVLPVNSELIDDIFNKYLLNEDNIILNISGNDFLLKKISDDVLIRYLPMINANNFNLPFTEANLYANKGIIAVSSDKIEKRFSLSYKIISHIINTRNIHVHIIEQNKFFTIDDRYQNLTNFYRPNSTIENMLKLSEQIPYGMLTIPSCVISSTIELLREIANDKLVILGTNNSCIEKIGADKFLHIIDDNSFFNIKSEPIKTNIHLGTLINNLRSNNHA